jgi:hypothetical protein
MGCVKEFSSPRSIIDLSFKSIFLVNIMKTIFTESRGNLAVTSNHKLPS